MVAGHYVLALYGPAPMRYTREVSRALDAGEPVVALESTIVAHGLPRSDSLRVAREIEDAVRAEGAVPATIGVVEGMVRIGLDRAGLEAIAGDADVAKCGVRDLPVVMARRTTGATTVSATAALAVRAGIGVFATGGLGGVHRGARASWDESADLTTLAQTPITIVCAGVKSILDVGATLERLETLNVTVLGYRTDRFAGFYLADSGFDVPWRVDTPEQVADVAHARSELGLGAVVVAQPLDEPLDAELHERVLQEGLEAAAREGVSGQDVTPFLLERFHRETEGASLAANVRLVLRNAALAARIARCIA
jgi:pseudouridylate synthase